MSDKKEKEAKPKKGKGMLVKALLGVVLIVNEIGRAHV